MADMKPPHASDDPMRVLFKIPTNPPPTVSSPENWSTDMNDFLAQTLVKEPDQRASAAALLKHPFITQYESEAKQIFKELADLILKCHHDHQLEKDSSESNGNGNGLGTNHIHYHHHHHDNSNSSPLSEQHQQQQQFLKKDNTSNNKKEKKEKKRQKGQKR